MWTYKSNFYYYTISSLLSDPCVPPFKTYLSDGQIWCLSRMCRHTCLFDLHDFSTRTSRSCTHWCLLRHRVQLANDRIYRVRQPSLSGKPSQLSGNPSLLCPAFQPSHFKTEQGILDFSHILWLKTYLNPKYHCLDIDGLLKLLTPTMTVWRSEKPIRNSRCLDIVSIWTVYH